MPDAGPALARHPHPFILDTAVHLATAAVLLHEGVEGGEQFRHGYANLPRTDNGDPTHALPSEGIGGLELLNRL